MPLHSGLRHTKIPTWSFLVYPNEHGDKSNLFQNIIKIKEKNYRQFFFDKTATFGRSLSKNTKIDQKY